jgi:hypothetical protein
MATLNMQGPYKLDSTTIDKVVSKISAGNYALGYSNEKTFFVKYVGRADNDLNKRLNDWIGHYKEFKFSYASSPKAAFEKECKNYHDFGENKSLDNKIHPDRPDNSGWKCPECTIFD